jgi:hypothetical protein
MRKLEAQREAVNEHHCKLLSELAAVAAVSERLDDDSDDDADDSDDDDVEAVEVVDTAGQHRSRASRQVSIVAGRRAKSAS